MLKDEIKNIPNKPGIYFWIDGQGKVLYVGRATRLKNRLSQYFLNNVAGKTREMVSLAKKIKTIETDSLLQAIILEAKYIKKYWPKYNIKDRDDRSFIYIVIPKKDFSYPLIIRGKDLVKYQEDDSKIFGPYQSFTLIKNALRIIRRIFPYGSCRPNSGQACFDYQIGLCPGSCLGLVGKRDYQKNINNIALLLSGKKEALMKKLLKENPEQFKSFQHLQEVALLEKEKPLTRSAFQRIEAYDITHLSGQETYGAMVVFNSAGEPQKDEYRLFKIKNNHQHDDYRALEEVLLRRLAHREWPYPNLIVIDGGRPQLDFLKKTFVKHSLEKVVGISELAGDKLIFFQKNNKNFQEEVLSIKTILLAARDEAHRFANSARKKTYRL